MPQRFLRPGIRTSPRWNAVSHRAARLYIAILTLVDDYGRYDGRTSVLWADAFAVWNEQNPQESAVNPQETAADCQQLAAAGLVGFYSVKGRNYLQVFQWQERARGNSKWPEPPQDFDSKLPQIPAESCGILPPSPSPSPSPSPIASSPLALEHQAFIKGWTQNFKAHFNFEYSFEGGRDGKAVKELLRLGIARIDLLEIAKLAWQRNAKTKSFNFEKASTIHGFKDYLNQIRTELSNGNTTGQQRPNPRNQGIAIGPTDYAEAAKRKLERQMAESKARGEI